MVVVGWCDGGGGVVVAVGGVGVGFFRGGGRLCGGGKQGRVYMYVCVLLIVRNTPLYNIIMKKMYLPC